MSNSTPAGYQALILVGDEFVESGIYPTLLKRAESIITYVTEESDVIGNYAKNASAEAAKDLAALSDPDDDRITGILHDLLSDINDELAAADTSVVLLRPLLFS